MASNWIPEGYHTVTPYIMARDPGGLIAFCQAAFGAEETTRKHRPDGSVMHAEIRIGDSLIMIGGAILDWPAAAATFYLYVDDVDTVYARAMEAGGITIEEPTLQSYGDRRGAVKDPYGNSWWMATRLANE
jgi:PhnB protein